VAQVETCPRRHNVKHKQRQHKQKLGALHQDRAIAAPDAIFGIAIGLGETLLHSPFRSGLIYAWMQTPGYLLVSTHGNGGIAGSGCRWGGDESSSRLLARWVTTCATAWSMPRKFP
jgi:hypothetical protein